MFIYLVPFINDAIFLVCVCVWKCVCVYDYMSVSVCEAVSFLCVW